VLETICHATEGFHCAGYRYIFQQGRLCGSRRNSKISDNHLMKRACSLNTNTDENSQRVPSDLKKQIIYGWNKQNDAKGVIIPFLTSFVKN